MSENTFEEKNSFRDYKTNSFDDGELQTRLYAEIYYESNNQEELRTTNIPTMTQFDSICNELNIVSENMHKPEDKQHLESKGAKEQFTYNDTLHIQNPVYSHSSVELQTSSDKSGQEANSMDDEYNSANNNKNCSTIKEKENFVKKQKSPSCIKKKHQKNNIISLNNSVSEIIHSKYNVCQKSKKREILSGKQDNKDQQMSDSSDSEVSIFEVPVPPKPKPLLIDLQDSDEENAKSVGKDNLHQYASKTANIRVTLAGINNELEVEETSSSQVASLKNKNISKFQRNKNTVNVGKTTQTTTHAQEDIVLNCSPIQEVASSINEIGQLSKNTEINPNQGDTLMESIKYKKRTPQKTKKYSENNDNNLQQETHMISLKRKLQTKKTQQNVNINNTECNVYDVMNKKQGFLDNLLINISCSDKNEAIEANAKRKCNSQINSNVKQKRQCTIQQDSQNVTSQDSNDKERREGDKYFTPMSQEMKDYYCNSTRGQENFDIGELQRNMSKDPKMWPILDEDLMPRPCNRQRNRFWNIRCSNCHQDGHQRYDCVMSRKMPCCYMCGTKGHTESRCSLKMCLTCGKQQNTYRKTCEYCRVLYCTMCNSVGHKASQCPDLWRRYHQTTDMSDVPQDLGNTIKPPNLLYCCNCTKRGHESSTCKEYRWSQHFLTPATVTNYTDGPTYEPDVMILSECDHNIPPPKAASSETLIPQNVMNTQQQATGEHSGLFTNVNSSLSAKANQIPILQEALDIPQEVPEEIFKADKIFENQETKQLTHIINEKVFIEIIYSCGKIQHKNNKNTRMICQNLSMLIKSLSPSAKSTVAKLEKRKVFPTFLQVLSDKNIQFEIKIGFTTCQHKNVMLQLITVENYLEPIYELLLHWLNLPNEEKEYGIDLTLPKNSTKMFNLLSTRMPQFKKMGFTSYDNHFRENDPRHIFFDIKCKKKNLKKFKGTVKQYYRERTKLWRLQTKLLMIVNTEPEPNKYIYMLQNAMKELELKQYQMSEELDNATYLKFTLLYNILFVPHTSRYLFSMLQRFEKHAKKQKLSNVQQLEKEQELEKEKNEHENHVLCTNVNLSFPFITPSISQDTNFVENPINIQQNMSNDITNEKEITNDILPINNTTNNDRDEIAINDSSVQIPSLITSFNTESVRVPSEDSERNNQSFTNDMNIESIVWISEQNAQFAMPQTQTKSVEKGFNKLLTNEKFNNKNPLSRKERRLNKKALQVIEQARKFQLPYMINAADELQRKLNNQMLNSKHVATVEKLIQLEKKYQKDITSYCNSLKT